MTRQQHNLLGFIREFQLRHNGLSTTVREMGASSGRHAARSVRLVDDAADLTAVPSTVLLAEFRRSGLEVAA